MHPDGVIENLWVGEGSVDLRLERHGGAVHVDVLGRRGDVEVLVAK
jgi:hypothetical protein